MKYMIMLYGSQRDYDAMAGKGDDAMSPEDLAAMHAYMGSVNQAIVESGEWVDAHGLTAPVLARRVRLRDGVPVVTDGPYAETEEVVAGFNIVDCESYDRAVEIAARFIDPSAEGQYVDIRPVLEDVSELEG